MPKSNQKNPWHDLRSSLTAIKLGAGMLIELPETKTLKSKEVFDTLNQIIEKCDLSIQQANLLQGEEKNER